MGRFEVVDMIEDAIATRSQDIWGCMAASCPTRTRSVYGEH